jgi:hypothetical protein
MNTFYSPSRFFPGGLFSFWPVVAFALLLAASAHGQFKFREPPNRQDPAALDAPSGELAWKQFLEARSIGFFRLEGSLSYRPPRRSSEAFSLLLEGDWSAESESTSITLVHSDGRRLHQRVVITGAGAAILDGSDNPVLKPLPAERLQQPLFEGLPFTWEDLLMPYLHWKPVSYLGPDRYLGRPAHRFMLRNPDPGLSPASVIVTIDRDYAALLSAELYAADASLLKRLRITGFKQFDAAWMFSGLTWEIRDSRESIKLDVLSFASGADAVSRL